MCFSLILLFDVIHIAQFAFSVAKAANTGLRKKEFFWFFFRVCWVSWTTGFASSPDPKCL